MSGLKYLFTALPVVAFMLPFLAFNVNAGTEPYVVSAEEIDSEQIGITYDQVLNNLSKVFVMEKTTRVNGKDRYMGKSSSGVAVLEIIGDRNNISQSNLTIGLPYDSTELVVENTGIMFKFLKNVAPEWENSGEWASMNLEKFNKSSAESAEKVVGNKLIEMFFFRTVGMIGLRVKHN